MPLDFERLAVGAGAGKPPMRSQQGNVAGLNNIDSVHLHGSPQREKRLQNSADSFPTNDDLICLRHHTRFPLIKRQERR
jgi:hypothetical protein